MAVALVQPHIHKLLPLHHPVSWVLSILVNIKIETISSERPTSSFIIYSLTLVSYNCRIHCLFLCAYYPGRLWVTYFFDIITSYISSWDVVSDTASNTYQNHSQSSSIYRLNLLLTRHQQLHLSLQDWVVYLHLHHHHANSHQIHPHFE